MAKPETYKGSDAVKIDCLKDYTVKAGSGAGAGPDIEYEAGKTYSVAPRTAVHLLRKVYAVRKDGKYVGDAQHFADAKADAEQAEGEKAQAAAKKAAKPAQKAADADAGGK